MSPYPLPSLPSLPLPPGLSSSSVRLVWVCIIYEDSLRWPLPLVGAREGPSLHWRMEGEKGVQVAEQKMLEPNLNINILLRIEKCFQLDFVFRLMFFFHQDLLLIKNYTISSIWGTGSLLHRKNIHFFDSLNLLKLIF